MKERGDDYLAHYVRSAPRLGKVTESVTHTPLDSRIINAWETTLAVLCLADHKIDTEQSFSKRKLFIDKSIAFLAGEVQDFDDDSRLKDYMYKLKEELNQVGNDRKKYFIRNLKLLCGVTEKLKRETNSSRFSALTRLEGQITSKLFLTFLPDEYRGSSSYRELCILFGRIGRSSNVFDTILDMSDDYENGETKIQPSIFNRAALLGSTLGDSWYVLKKINPTLAAKMMLKGVGLIKTKPQWKDTTA